MKNTLTVKKACVVGVWLALLSTEGWVLDQNSQASVGLLGFWCCTTCCSRPYWRFSVLSGAPLRVVISWCCIVRPWLRGFISQFIHFLPPDTTLAHAYCCFTPSALLQPPYTLHKHLHQLLVDCIIEVSFMV